MKSPGDTRPTWRNGILQIHITRACDESCVGCTQGSNLAGKPVMMTLDNFYDAVISVKDYYGVIGIFGGNPTLHPQFEQICNIFASIIPFEQRGLWSNNLRGYGELCRRIFNPAVSNLNVHTRQSNYDEMKKDWPECHPIGLDNDSRHSPPYVAMKDLGLGQEEMERLISSCDINQLWSAMICQFRGELRGFFCEIAGAQSMLHEAEESYPDTGIKIYPGWWKLPIERFAHQISKHCFECGIPLKGLGDLAVEGNNEFVSETHKDIYKLKRPQGKTLHLVKSREELGGHLNRATDYISNGLVKKMNKSVKIIVGGPTAGYSRNDKFYDSFLAMQKPEGTLQSFARGQSPAEGRNRLIELALEQDCTHIMFLDDDVLHPPDIIHRLLAHDKDIVGGLYLMRNFPHRPIMFHIANDDGTCAWRQLGEQEDGLIKVVNMGAGACLIKTDVFRKMKEKGFTFTAQWGPQNLKRDVWFTLGELQADTWCDDIAFFNRARKCGFDIYVDLDVRCGHLGQVAFWPTYQDGKWFTAYDTNGEQTVSVPQPMFVRSEINEVEEIVNA